MRAPRRPAVRRRETRRTGFGAAATAVAALVAVVGVLGATPPAAAIPPGGAGGDTPGTSSSVSPATLQACQTLAFTVSGFPAGETVYIKIDDGVGYGDTSVQGSGTYQMQAIPASGTVNGSLTLPCDIAPGDHWLRYLASQYVDADDPGAGTIGYTNRGASDFTVVAASAGSGGSASGGGLGGAAPAAGTTSGSGAEQVGGQGGTLVLDAGAATASATATPGAASGSGPAATSGALPAADPAPADDGVPRVGLIVLAILVVAAALTVGIVLRRRRSAP